MTALQTLLVATDFSMESRQAAMRAARIARDAHARLELLHVMETRGLAQLKELFGDASEALSSQLESDFRRELDELAASIGEPMGISAGQHLRSGHVLNEMCNMIDALDASLVVMGAHGAGFIRQILLGTTAERLLRRSRRPLLAVRKPADRPYQRVLVAVDFSPGSVTAIQFARALAPETLPTLFHAFEIPFEGKLRFAEAEESGLDHYRSRARHAAVLELQRVVMEAGLSEADHHSLIVHGAPAVRLLEAARQLEADLIVVCKHGVSMTEELLLGSVTRQVLAEADCDILVVR